MNNDAGLSMHSKLVRLITAFLTVSLICFQLAAKYWGHSSLTGTLHWWVPGIWSGAAIVFSFYFIRRTTLKKFFITLVIILIALWVGYVLGQLGLDYRVFGVLGILLFVIVAVSCICLFCKGATEKLQKAIDFFYSWTPQFLLVGSMTLLIRTVADLANAKVSDWLIIPFVIIVLVVIIVMAISPHLNKVNTNAETTKSN